MSQRKGAFLMTPQNDAANSEHWCLAPIAESTVLPGLDRAALIKGVKWTPGEIITISFLGGTPLLQQRVRDVASEWTDSGMANLIFEFRSDTTDTDIRIAFMAGQGSWSFLGNSCRNIPPPQPTMNYGWLTETSSDQEVRRVVLHEFGHALGLIHEHQHPEGCLKWNYVEVIQQLSNPPNNWGINTVIHNVFQAQAESETNFSQMDTDSIMMYPIPASWTIDGFSATLNDELSETDKAFIREEYP
jgi:serralysin